MYRNCIFCSAPLGANEALETFPVGRQLAFDAWKGRLWAVCPFCGRWNLSPIEERWESVEEAEKLFRDARLRVQSENVGVAQLPDGTRLVRVGTAVPGELAAWRYGKQLLRRRRRYFVGSVAGVVGSVALYSGVAATGAGVVGFIAASSWFDSRRKQKIVHRLPDPDGARRDVIVRRWHLEGVRLGATDTDGELAIEIRDAHRKKPGSWDDKVRRKSKDIVIVSGSDARTFLARAMVHINHKGATPGKLSDANSILSDVGSAEKILRIAAANGSALGDRAGNNPKVIKPTDALVLEMALNEESERRALEGELAGLEAAWREAEEIAAIADSLPGEALLNRFLDRVSG
jgi:hypothetical protein